MIVGHHISAKGFLCKVVVLELGGGSTQQTSMQGIVPP
jgi:hypothetical protein